MSHEIPNGEVNRMAGLFGDMFDFNHDGKLDAFERASEFDFIHNVMGNEEQDKKDELENAGLDVNDLEYMDDDERREAIESAGLDPDDYDF